MTKKYSDHFIQSSKRLIKDQHDSYTIKKGVKTKAKEKEFLDQYKDYKDKLKETGPAPLTPLQEKFVNIYCSRYGEKSATQCAIDAGYGSLGAHTRASELLNHRLNPHVVLEIQNRLAMLRDQWDIDRDKHLAMLTKIRDEARIKGQYGVVAKCEELRGKVGGLYIEKSMVLTKDIKEEDGLEKFKQIYDTRDDFDKAMLVMGEEMFPDQKSDMYDDVEVELSAKEKESIAASEELDRYQANRRKERERGMRIASGDKRKSKS
tara:strand:- start:64 stop:852 length:789 start_codon:yes stop_codon:yes gene_type:complete